MLTKKWSLSSDRCFAPEPEQRQLARQFFYSISSLPLVCPHGHVDPALLANPAACFGSPTELLIIPDHYIFRMLYSRGIPLSALGIPSRDGWLGALITCYEIIGTPGITPVRRLINRAASMIPTRKLCLAMVVAPKTNQLAGLYIDKPELAWKAAAKLSAKLHIKYVDKPFKQVLSVMPEMYDDIWTAAKGMYKLEPVVADGGEVIIYAPHITEFSYTHGRVLAEIGYHVRDYFLKQWDKFQEYPAGVLAHSTHLKGMGTFDFIEGEKPRIRVTLATGISPERCAAHNLSYRDPATIELTEWSHREHEGILLVPKAGEILYRLK